MLRLVTGGLQTTVQDLGRMGHQRSGVPVGGAMDRVALRVGNLLVGNAEGAAAIEASLIGPAITFGQGTLIAVTMAPRFRSGGPCTFPRGRRCALGGP
jgi:antagonist of KipI